MIRPPLPTNWYIITGSSCAGKTTIIKRLEELGFQVVYEPARIYIESETSKGRAMDDVLSDLLSDKVEFQKWMFSMKLEAENNLRPDDVVFLDRALPDSLAYYKIWGIDQTNILAECMRFNYKKVFLFERLPFINDGVRLEDESERILLENLVGKEYGNLGYELIKIPVMPIESRLVHILNLARN